MCSSPSMRDKLIPCTPGRTVCITPFSLMRRKRLVFGGPIAAVQGGAALARSSKALYGGMGRTRWLAREKGGRVDGVRAELARFWWRIQLRGRARKSGSGSLLVIREIEAGLNAVDLDLDGSYRALLPKDVAVHRVKLHADFDLPSLEVFDVTLHLCHVGLHPPQDFKNQAFRLLDHSAP